MFLATTACTGGGTAYRTVSGAGRGGLPLRRRFTLPLIEPFCPHPSDPRSKSALPTLGKGEIIVIFCKGLRPLHPCVCAEDGTAYRAVYGTGRGLAPALVGSALPLPVSVGVSAPCVAGSPCLRLNLFAPSFRPALEERSSHAGEGGVFCYLLQGASPLASLRLRPCGIGFPCSFRYPEEDLLRRWSVLPCRSRYLWGYLLPASPVHPAFD